MSRLSHWRTMAAMAVASSTLFGAGCVQDVGDIDRTQPEAIDKAMFQNDDEWFYRQTVVETDFSGNSPLFEAVESSMKRIRWEVTEDVLYAYSTVEPAENALDGVVDEDGRRLGVVAAFPIQGHFDIQRAYSSATGEQSNVITENGSDRHWYERKYMRVAWDTNLVDGMGMFGGMAGSMSSIGRAVPQTEGRIDPNRTRISETYIDTVNEFYYEPDVYSCYGLFGLDGIYNCEGGATKVRSSFLKAPKNETYVPLNYTDNMPIAKDDEGVDRLMTTTLYDQSLGYLIEVECTPEVLDYEFVNDGSPKDDACSEAYFDMFTRFGYFRTERIRYDEKRPTADDNRLYYANRWNIWQSMIEEEDCQDWQQCTVLPMDQRIPKPITYHLNPEFPQDMYDAAQLVGQAWSDNFKKTVAIAQGKTVTEVEEQLEGLYGHRDMFRIEWNNCSAPKLQQWYDDGLPGKSILDDFVAEQGAASVEEAFWGLADDKREDVCAELEWATRDKEQKFDWQRVGDLRYSFFNWVTANVPWSGYGPSAADPLTGQIISGNANYAGTSLRWVAAIGADYVQFQNGELSDQEVIFGDHVARYIAQKRAEMRTQQQELSPAAKREMTRRTGHVASAVSPTNFEDRVDVRDLPKEFLKAGPERVMREASRMAEAAYLADSADTRMAEMMDDPEIKRVMLQDPNFETLVRSIAHERFGPEFTDDDFHQAYLNVQAPKLALDRYERRNAHFAERNMLSHEHMDRALTALATYSGAAEYFAGKSRDVIERYFMDSIFAGTQLHEVGHTVGLRHNFSASMDALNFHDEFWKVQLAVAEGEIQQAERFSVPSDVAATIDGDAPYVNQAEYMLASVMDYTGDLTGRFGGLGKYDEAAIAFAYAESVQQWRDDIPLSNFIDFELWISDYSELPRIFSGQGGQGIGSAAQQTAGIDNIINGREYVPISVAVETRRNSILANTSDWQNGAFSISNPPKIDRSVPFNFCTDDRRDYELGCDVFDWGANQREIINHQFNTYRLFQPFRRYKRHNVNRLTENVSRYYSWVLGIFGSIERPFRYYSIYQWWDIGSFTDDLREAAIDAMNFYAEVMATPSPGRYCMYGNDTAVNEYWYFDLNNTYVPARWDSNDGECANYIDIPKGQGQFYGYDFTDEYEYRILRVGTFVDKLISAVMLFSVSANFTQSAFFTDQRATNISYWTLFQDEMYEYLRGIILGDYQKFAGVYNPQTGQYEPPKIVDEKTFGLGLPNPQDGMERIYTTMSFNHEWNILLGGMLNASTWSDRYPDFMQYLKISVAEDERQTYPADLEVRTFEHPLTGQIYEAPILRDGRSITAELVDWANVLKTRYEEAVAARAATTPGTSQYSNANDLVISRSQQMEDVVAKLDSIRFVWYAVDGLK